MGWRAGAAGMGLAAINELEAASKPPCLCPPSWFLRHRAHGMQEVVVHNGTVPKRGGSSIIGRDGER